MKRTKLKRSAKPMKRTAPFASNAKPMKRKSLRPVSEHRREVNAERETLLIDTFGPREEWHCAFGVIVGARLAEKAITLDGFDAIWENDNDRCVGAVNGHETLKRSRAGSTDANLLDVSSVVTLCNRHNDWCEDHPELANKLGLARHAWEQVSRSTVKED